MTSKLEIFRPTPRKTREVLPTSAGALEAGATVIREPRKGYGQACLTGIAALAKGPPDIVVFVDGDYSDRASEMGSVVQPIVEEEADLVIGSWVLGTREPGAPALASRRSKSPKVDRE